MKPRDRIGVSIEAAVEDAWADAFARGRPHDADGLLVLHDLLVRALAEARGIALEDSLVEAQMDQMGVPHALRQMIYHARNLLHLRAERIKVANEKDQGRLH